MNTESKALRPAAFVGPSSAVYEHNLTAPPVVPGEATATSSKAAVVLTQHAGPLKRQLNSPLALASQLLQTNTIYTGLDKLTGHILETMGVSVLDV